MTPSMLRLRVLAAIGASGLAVLSAEACGSSPSTPTEHADASADAVAGAMREAVARLRARIPGVRVVGATLTPALNATNPGYGTRKQDDSRRALNAFIKTSGVFDAVADFDAVILDPATGEIREPFVPETTTGRPGDKLHPNRAGYLAMGEAIDLAVFGVSQ